MASRATACVSRAPWVVRARRTRFDVEEDDLGVDDAHELAVLPAHHGRDPAPVAARREGGPSAFSTEEVVACPLVEVPTLDPPVAGREEAPSAVNVASSICPA